VEEAKKKEWQAFIDCEEEGLQNLWYQELLCLKEGEESEFLTLAEVKEGMKKIMRSEEKCLKEGEERKQK
jgi:hypothetical protein